MNRFRNGIKIALLVILMGACRESDKDTGCGGPQECIEIKKGDPITLAAVQALSGPVASFGKEQLEMINLAIKEKGPIAGHPVELITFNSSCSSEGGINAAYQIRAKNNIAGVLGPTCSSAAKELIRLLSPTGLSIIAALPTAAELTTPDGINQGEHWRPGFFRTSYNDHYRGKGAARFAYDKLQMRKAATLEDGEQFSSGLAKSFGKFFTAAGGQLVLAGVIDKEDKNLGPFLSALIESKAEFLFLPIFQPAGTHLVNQLKAHPDLKKIKLLATDPLLSDDFIKKTAPHNRGIYFITPAIPNTTDRTRLKKEFKKLYGEAPITGEFVFAYESTVLLLTAIENTAIKTKEGIRIPKKALRQHLNKTQPGKYGDLSQARYSIKELTAPEKGTAGITIVYTYKQDQ